MSESYVTVLGTSRTILKLGRFLNLVLIAVLIFGLPASMVFDSALRDYYGSRPSMDADRLIPTLRAAMILGLPMLAAVHILLSRLLDLVETVRTGDPFVPENAVRMRTIAWSLLAIQLTGIGFSIVAGMLRAGGAKVGDWDFSLAGWVSVLLLFVLARVFEKGTQIRSDLEAMI